MEAFARNMVRLFDQGTKAFSALAERTNSNGQGPYSMASEAGEAAKSLGEIARHWAAEPAKFATAQSESFASYADLWGHSVRRFLGEEVEPVVEPEPGDNRFKDPDWSNGQVFDFWKQAYLITSRWAEELTRNTSGVDDKTRKKALFYFVSDALGDVALEIPAHQSRGDPHHARDQRGEFGAGHDAFRRGSRAVEGLAPH